MHIKQWGLVVVVSLFLLSSTSGQVIDHWETLVYAEDEWRYLVPSSEPDENWKKSGFDDSAWSKGQGGIGYGDGDDRTIISQTISLYMRRSFTLDNTARVLQAVLNMDYDDGFVAYLNEVEIARGNLGNVGQSIAYSQSASGLREAEMYQGREPIYVMLDQDKVNANLKSGENILAIQVHNDNLNSSDMSAIAFFSIAVSDTQQLYGNPPAWFDPPEPISDTFESNLPIVVINTNGRTIPNEPKIDARMGVIYDPSGGIHRISDGFNNYNGKIGIEIRGSSSLSFAKKQYLLETRNEDNSNNNVSLMGMPKENDWILNAPFSDKSLMRNVLTYRLGRDLGRYAPRTHFCEVIINDEYMGVFVLMEKIKRDKNRVNISKLKVDETSGEDLTGGYIVKIDRSQGNKSWFSPVRPIPGGNQRTEFVYHYPDSDDIQPEQEAYIREYITDFEQALEGADFSHPDKGYLPYVDLLSFVDFFLMNELSRNVDAYRLSTYMYKDKGGKLTMGPLWDFNLAFGNADYCEGGSSRGWQFRRFNEICAGDAFVNPSWWTRFMRDTTFCQAAVSRWSVLRNNRLSNNRILAVVDSLTQELEDAQERNFDRWPVLGRYIWPNNFVGNSFDSEIGYLKDWIRQRLAWMDDNLPAICSYKPPVFTRIPGQLHVMPNPFEQELRFVYSLSSIYQVQLEIFDLKGRKLATLLDEKQDRGDHEAFWNGLLDTGQAASAGIYIAKLQLSNGQTSSVKVLKY